MIGNISLFNDYDAEYHVSVQLKTPIIKSILQIFQVTHFFINQDDSNL